MWDERYRDESVSVIVNFQISMLGRIEMKEWDVLVKLSPQHARQGKSASLMGFVNSCIFELDSIRRKLIGVSCGCSASLVIGEEVHQVSVHVLVVVDRLVGETADR